MSGHACMYTYMYVCICMCIHMYCLFTLNKIIFPCFHFFAGFGMLFKGMVQNSLLSKDESLTPYTDKVMAV